MTVVRQSPGDMRVIISKECLLINNEVSAGPLILIKFTIDFNRTQLLVLSEIKMCINREFDEIMLMISGPVDTAY